jgi:hypothetical protein
VENVLKNKRTETLLIVFLLFKLNYFSAMDLKISSVVFIFLLFQSIVKAQYTICDHAKFINTVGGSLNVSHVASLGSCRYKVFAPAETIIQATCSIKLTCGTHVFAVSRNGEKDLSDQVTYCGVGNIPVVKSVGNEIVVALDTKNTFTATFSCQFISIALDSTNCDCGWDVATKIVGGTVTKVNGYVSHAALIDKPTKELFCGSTLRKFF